MNAIFGIILNTSSRETHLIKAQPELRSWGDEVFEVGDEKFVYPMLEAVEFKIYPVTEYIRKKLTLDFQGQDAEYASIEGLAVDEYENWLRVNGVNLEEIHPLESGLKALIDDIGICSLLLIPDSDRLEEITLIESDRVIRLLREHISNLSRSSGFLVSITG